MQRVGKLTLDRNPDNFFAETEQVAFHPGHLVPGIDFTNDPLLQGRLFSYTDTQLIRLGGPNFHEIPINRPVAPVHNNQRDGHMRQTINTGQASYQPNTLGGGCPLQAGRRDGRLRQLRGEDRRARRSAARGEKFFDHFSQATLFWNSQSRSREGSHRPGPPLRAGQGGRRGHPGAHARHARRGRQDPGGRRSPRDWGWPCRRSWTAREPERARRRRPKDFQPRTLKRAYRSLAGPEHGQHRQGTAKTRKVAILAADGVDGAALAAMQRALKAAGAQSPRSSRPDGSAP